MENQDVLRALVALRNSGIAVGFSTSGVGQSETIFKALEIAFDGELLFSSVQSTWNVLEQSADSALQAAHEAGLKVIVKEAVANGRLTSRNPNLPRFSGLAEQYNTTMDGLALSAVINRPWISVVLSGAANAAHLRSNLKAQEIVWSEELEQSIKSFCETPENYWTTRSSLAWN